MEEKPIPEMDKKMIPDSLQMMKCLIPFLPSQMQMMFCLFIKIMEMRCIIFYFENHPSGHTESATMDLSKMFDSLRPYMDKSFSQMFDMLHQMSDMKEMMNGMDFSDFSADDLAGFAENLTGMHNTQSDENVQMDENVSSMPNLKSMETAGDHSDVTTHPDEDI